MLRGLVVVVLVLAATTLMAGVALAYDDADSMDDGGISGAGSSDVGADDGGEGPATSPGYASPTQNDPNAPGPAGLPSGVGPAMGPSLPNSETLSTGPGGNTGPSGSHETDTDPGD
jgi:hypothetical protein